MKHEYTKKINNIILRPLKIDDIENLRNWRNEKGNSRFLRQIPYITEDAQKIWYEQYLNNDDEICFAVEECQELNRMVGSLSLYNFKGDMAEFGKILIGDKEAHGRQVGCNATIAAIKIAFEELGLKRLVLEVYQENIAALKTYEKAGFVFNSVLRNDNIGQVFLYEISI